MKKLEENVIDCTTKIFGKKEYSVTNGVNFDNVEVVLNGKVSNFRGSIFEGLNEVQLKKAVHFIDSLELLDAKARKKWLELLEEEDEEVCYYINEHHDAYGEEIKEQILEKLKVEKQDSRAFIEGLEFGSFHIYSLDEEESDSIELVMDYSLIWEGRCSFTDQILAMHFSDKLEYEMHTHDS